ncbi:hypothetical protein EYF80_022974 [Liparis tanakae]|uniref:Uncharacterized protein n=1 Tax=Liparis tanakae TaxID=230148 RepID=A0A4Z2HPN2_9TELE|nr:hypothetical protein EYF80_022974 [Liparis tanakae]
MLLSVHHSGLRRSFDIGGERTLSADNKELLRTGSTTSAEENLCYHQFNTVAAYLSTPLTLSIPGLFNLAE